MMPTIDMDIWLNQLAQGIPGGERLLDAFASADEGEQRMILRRANVLVLEAGAHETDVEAAVLASRVRPTRTAAIVLGKGRLREQLARVSTLPVADLRDGLMLTVSLLSIADRRRRQTRCIGGCQHWWHGDLSDELFLQRVRSEQTS